MQDNSHYTLIVEEKYVKFVMDLFVTFSFIRIPILHKKIKDGPRQR